MFPHATPPASDSSTQSIFSRIYNFVFAATASSPTTSSWSPTTSGWLFDYVNALLSTAVPAVNDVLKMPEGTKVMNVDDLGRYIFIRPCYFELWSIISRVIEEGNVSRFIVMGIPGIGKTTFLYYLLHVLVKQNICVVFEDFKGLMFMVQRNGEVFEGKRGDPIFKDSLADSSTYYLFNCGGSISTTTPLLESVSAVTIVASSPSEDHTKELSKTNHNVYYMPMWKLDELELCRTHCASTLTMDVVADRFATWGGVARQVFFMGSKVALRKQLDSALARFKEKPQEVLGCVGGADSQMVSHKLLHYKVDESSFEAYSLMLASDYIGDRMCAMSLNGVVERIALLQTHNEEHALRGKLFEHYAHRVLPLGSTAFGNNLLKMSPVGAGKDVLLPEAADRKGIRTTRDLRLYRETSGIYLQPEVPNFPVVDSLLTPLIGYQVTVSSTHDVKVESFKTLLDELGCTKKRKFRLVWVVPVDIEFKCTPLCATIKDRVEQFTLKLPLLVPPSLLKAIADSPQGIGSKRKR